MEKRKRGRPMASHDAKFTPEFRENPDVEKLARALIAVAMSIAQKKEAEEKTTQKSHDEGKGDDMT